MSRAGEQDLCPNQPVTHVDLVRHDGEVPAVTGDFTAVLRELTERERQVVLRLAMCDSNRAIARRLLITERTVKAHLSSVMAKLGATSRIEVAVIALRHHDVLCPCSRAGTAGVPKSNTARTTARRGWTSHPITCEKG